MATGTNSLSACLGSHPNESRIMKNRIATITGLMFLIVAQTSHAGSATWKVSPATGNWTTAANWTPATVPDGPSDTATFATSNQPAVLLPDFSSTEVNGIVFAAGAPAYTITVGSSVGNGMSTLELSGAGITNSSGNIQTLIVDPSQFLANSGILQFSNGAVTGDSTSIVLAGGAGIGGLGANMNFLDTSAAGSGSVMVQGGTTIESFGGQVVFFDATSAGNGAFTINGGTAAAPLLAPTGGFVDFLDTSTAGQAVLTNNGGTATNAGGGITQFAGSATAGAATLIANGGLNGGKGAAIYFHGPTTGGTSRVEVFDTGQLDLSGHDVSGLTIGSLEGSGLVFLGANQLTVGGTNLSTTFSGKIQNGGIFHCTNGSLSKVGSGTLTLSGGSNYTGGTTVNGGALLVTNGSSGSATGNGALQVNAGLLGGTGRVLGTVAIATDTSAANLAPGPVGLPGRLIILKALTFNSRATFNVELNSSTIVADYVAANGVTIKSGALVSIADLGSSTVRAGHVFRIISNAASTPIAGTFNNLADGATITIGSNNYQVSYEGGDGNDFTLTVVP
jgi:autotransporter-associated beta strand protein